MESGLLVLVNAHNTVHAKHKAAKAESERLFQLLEQEEVTDEYESRQHLLATYFRTVEEAKRLKLLHNSLAESATKIYGLYNLCDFSKHNKIEEHI